jgi:hypothetical protein
MVRFIIIDEAEILIKEQNRLVGTLQKSKISAMANNDGKSAKLF